MCSPIARCRPITLYQPVVNGKPLDHAIQVCELHGGVWSNAHRFDPAHHPTPQAGEQQP